MAVTINADNGVSSGSAGLKQTADSTGVLALQTNGTTAVTVDTSQNVGIGTSSPGSTLDVNGTIVARCPAGGTGLLMRGRSSDNLSQILGYDNGVTTLYGQLQFSSTGGGVTTLISNGATGYTNFYTNGSERMRIDSSGNVGIGTSSPNYKLTLQDSSNFSIHLLKTGSNDGWIRNIGTMDIAAASGGGSGQTITFSTGANYAGLTEKARIDGSGNLLINTTSMPSGYSKLGFVCNGDGSTWQNLGATGAAAPTTLAFLNSSGTRVGYIAQSGTATAFTSTSDYRLKENVQPMVGALEKVAQLKPCTYKWKSTGGDGQGFIAHELQAVVPDCVNGEKDEVDADGNPRYQGVDTSFLVATLTAAIQEQQALIQTLTDRITALEAK